MWNFDNYRVFVLAAVVCIAACDKPTLLVSKSILNKYIVENEAMVVVYNIYNPSAHTAANIRLEDPSFPLDKFELISGSLSAGKDLLASMSNVSHIVILKPITYGAYNFTWAKIRYTNMQNEHLQIGTSHEPGLMEVMSFVEYNRKFSMHLKEWLIFLFMASPCVGLPFLLWYKSHYKYTRLTNVKKKKSLYTSNNE